MKYFILYHYMKFYYIQSYYNSLDQIMHIYIFIFVPGIARMVHCEAVSPPRHILGRAKKPRGRRDASNDWAGGYLDHLGPCEWPPVSWNHARRMPFWKYPSKYPSINKWRLLLFFVFHTSNKQRKATLGDLPKHRIMPPQIWARHKAHK